MCIYIYTASIHFFICLLFRLRCRQCLRVHTIYSAEWQGNWSNINSKRLRMKCYGLVEVDIAEFIRTLWRKILIPQSGQTYSVQAQSDTSESKSKPLSVHPHCPDSDKVLGFSQSAQLQMENSTSAPVLNFRWRTQLQPECSTSECSER